MICYENRMVPICGVGFKNSDFGARIFCKMLGKSGGKAGKSQSTLNEDAYMVGRCSEADTDLTKCTETCNKRTIGGSCFGNSCNAFSTKSAVDLHCFGKMFLILHKTVIIHIYRVQAR